MSLILTPKKEPDEKRLLGYPKISHKAEIAFIIVGALIMLIPFIVGMGHPAPIAGTIIVGFLFALIGAVVLFDTSKKYKKREKAYREGKQFSAVVTAVHHTVKRTPRSNRADNRTHCYCVECELTDPDTNEKYLYTSHYVILNLHPYVGRQVRVYVDMTDRSNYYVDLSSLSEGENQ